MTWRLRKHFAAYASLILCLSASMLRAQDQEDEFAILLATAREKFDRGELHSAEAAFTEILEAAEEPREEDRPSAAFLAAARAGLLHLDLRRGLYARVKEQVLLLEPAEQASREAKVLRATALQATGDYETAAAIWQQLATADPTDFEARCRLGESQAAAGAIAAARATWSAAAAAAAPADAERLAFHARCIWRLGDPKAVVTASGELVAALEKAPKLAVARTLLGVLRFQVYGEASGFPSGERDLKQVLDAHGDVEEALLWLYRLRSSNFVLDGAKTESYLDRALAQNPRCVEAIVLRGARVLDDRRYRDAAEVLDGALAVDARDKVALAHRAAAAWLLHDEKAYASFRERALVGDPNQGLVDRILGEHLIALYRFADALPFLERALQLEPDDVPSLHAMGKALVYTGQGSKAREVLLRAKGAQPGFVDPWRNNALAVQQLLDEQYVRAGDDRFDVAFHRDDQEVLQEYLLPILFEAFEVLGKKYDYRPERKVAVEVFHTWDDFSVRTIGFRGFTALGACFGPFVTLVSPGDTDLRRQDFMWEATAWHEYVHVLTLGLSKHRVPRWLTEGFSVYEEGQRDRTFERGMDRELFDAFHNQDIPPVRLLNRLFRGDRILFGYYQGGLIVDLIARDFGFDKAIELLRAFGDDLETEAAFVRALGISSREFDERFLRYVEKEKLRGIKLVPRFDDAAVHRLLTRIAKDPADLDARLDVAWAFVQRDNPVDAGPHLAFVLQREPDNGRALLVRAAMLLGRGETEAAMQAFERGFAAGADDFDSRTNYARALQKQGDLDGALRQFLRAKACWPGCTDQGSAPELAIAAIKKEQGDREGALMEWKAYCKKTARAYAPRWSLAEFEREAGNREQEVRWLAECNRIDPFRREQHVLAGEALLTLGRRAEAALEFEVAAAVPTSLDRKYTARGAERPPADEPGEREERGRLLLRAGRLRHELGDAERAVRLVRRVVDTLPATEAAAEAKAQLLTWQPR